MSHELHGQFEGLWNWYQDDSDDEDELDEEAVWLRAEEARKESLSTHDLEQEEKRQNAAMREIQKAESALEMFALMQTMIEENWLCSINELPGNIYRIWAFGGLSLHGKTWGDAFPRLCRVVGGATIIIIQYVASPVLCLGQFIGWGVEPRSVLHWSRWHVSLSDWQGPHAFIKFIALGFLFCFLTNGMLVLLNEQRSGSKINRAFYYLKQHRKKHMYMSFLLIDVVNNCWVVFWCSLASFPIIGSSASAQEVVFNALTVVFLYSIDDVGGDLNFVEADKWPGKQIGWVHHRIFRLGTASSTQYIDVSTWGLKAYTIRHLTMFIYQTTFVALFLMWLLFPVLFILTPFMEMRGPGTTP